MVFRRIIDFFRIKKKKEKKEIKEEIVETKREKIEGEIKVVPVEDVNKYRKEGTGEVRIVTEEKVTGVEGEKEKEIIVEEAGERKEEQDYTKTTKEEEEIRRIIAIANQKGGVGKSTTAINMSASMANMGKKVILIDIDPQANTTSGLGINKYEVNRSIYDAIIEKVNINKLIKETKIDGLFIIPSNIHLAGAEIELVNMMMREHRLRKVIEPIRNNYDFIIIDCPPALGILTINALVAADEVIVPIQCEYYALEGLGQLIKTIELVKNNLNSNLEISGFVMTMYDSRTKLASQVVEEVKRYFGEKVYRTIIPRNVRVSEAPSYGLPVIFYDPNCKGSLAYKNFTKEVINHGKKRIGEGT